MKAQEIIRLLNTSDERSDLEAKKGSSIDRSILETVCAFSNEPGLGGGIIILGVKEAEDTLFPSYKVVGIDNPDKLQKDLATQCADQFNQPVRPFITIEELNDNQKLALVFLREVGAIDNNSYRQLTGANRSQAGVDLRDLREKKLIDQRSTGKSTYYLPASSFLDTMVDKGTTMVGKDPTMVGKDPTMVGKEIPNEIRILILKLGKRSRNQELMEKTIIELCKWRDLSIAELSEILQRNEKYIKTNYIQPLIEKGKIVYTIPEMLTHPKQKYRTSGTKEKTKSSKNK